MGYTPGHGATAVAFMAARTLERHAPALVPLLRPGLRVVDVGCGPGSITCGIAARVAPGEVTAVDAADPQVEEARRAAAEAGLGNVRALRADAAALPLPDGAADVALVHAVAEHLQDPVAALAEVRRVLVPGGAALVTSPDWGGFLLMPPDAGAETALTRYRELQTAQGGDVRAGRRLGGHMRSAGFGDVAVEARYEMHDPAAPIAGYLADRLAREGDDAAAAALRAWGARPDALFAQCWVDALGRA
ncbi:MAG TPA: methyltransferase domain-containing protein [Miltoncostaeaceae bacterium]|nr:methyltransferase domain-containing protein [Miltoncostaeaceae bacterium]